MPAWTVAQRHALADPRLRFIANPDNPGFAVACNQGTAASTAPWLAFVNPDCFVEADSLARCARMRMARDGLRRATARRDVSTAYFDVAVHGKSGDDVVLGADLVDEDGLHDAAARRRDPEFAAMLRDPARRQLGIAIDPSQPLQAVDAVSVRIDVAAARLVRMHRWFRRRPIACMRKTSTCAGVRAARRRDGRLRE
jgi:N-acetylglucosaminyl-diphospho-decaprenol L-rhamnosyltransferase